MVGRGLPKKGGFAGWGRPGEEDGVAILDEHDPNYLPDNEREQDESEYGQKEESAGTVDQAVNPPKVETENVPPAEAPSKVEAH